MRRRTTGIADAEEDRCWRVILDLVARAEDIGDQIITTEIITSELVITRAGSLIFLKSPARPVEIDA